MSLKFICVLIIFTLATIGLVVEARGGRGRSGSLGSTFYRRSHKKHSSSGGSSSRRKFVSGSPVHTAYTQSMISSGRSHAGHDGHSFADSLFGNHNSHGGSKGKVNSHSQSNHYKTEHRANGWRLHNSSPAHTWGDHKLKPGHVYVRQTSNMPANAVYYAQPPKYSSSTGDSIDFALGYLVGRSLFHDRQRHRYNHHQQEPERYASYSTNSDIDPGTIGNPTTAPAVDKNNGTNQTNYWPTDFEVSLAPLNNTLLPDTVTASPQATIFKKLPIVTAQKISMDNLTFELPTVTAEPPAKSPTNGIICMPWSFNETDATQPERIVTIVKTVCFPAPSPPPTTTTTTTTAAPIAGDIRMDDKCACPPLFIYSTTVVDSCCFTPQRLEAELHRFLN